MVPNRKEKTHLLVLVAASSIKLNKSILIGSEYKIKTQFRKLVQL